MAPEIIRESLRLGSVILAVASVLAAVLIGTLITAIDRPVRGSHNTKNERLLDTVDRLNREG